MRSLNTNYIVFDQPWTNEYDKYLKRFDQQYSDAKDSLVSKKPVQSDNEISHNVMFNTIFQTARLKRPVINIYKRPI